MKSLESHFPYHTGDSVRRAYLAAVRSKQKIDLIVLSHYMKPKSMGGKGYGKLKLRHKRIQETKCIWYD